MATDAIDDFIALPRDQQMSMLQQLSPEKQDKLLATIKQRRTKKAMPTGPQPEARTVGNYASEIVRGVGRGIADDVAGVYNTVRHPGQTAAAILPDLILPGAGLIAPLMAGRAAAKGSTAPVTQGTLTTLENLPLVGPLVQRAEEGQGRVASPESVGAAAEGITEIAAPEAVGPVLKGVGKVGRRIAEATTKTSPRDTAALVEKTRADNEAATAKAVKENTEQATKRAAEVKKFGNKLAEARAATAEREAAISRKTALQRGVKKLDAGLQEDLKATEDRVNKEANTKYNNLREALKDEKAGLHEAEGQEPVTMVQHLYDTAVEPLRGSETESNIIKSLGKRVQSGDVDLTYNDLQGYREEIGRQLRKGLLEPDTFTAYKRLMPEIDNAMQEIANRKGLGKAQLDARNFYRQYAEAFLDNGPIRKAIDSPEHEVARHFSNKDVSGVQQLAKFNPELARSINTVRGYLGEAREIRPSKAMTKEPTLAPAKPPVTAEVKKIGTEDVRKAKEGGLAERRETLRRRGEWIALGTAGYGLFRDLANRRFGEIPKNLAEGAMSVGAVAGLSKLLEQPKIVELLTKPTARDIAQIPPELRGDILPALQEAQKQGIEVSPALLGAITGSRNYPRGPNTRKLESMRGNSAAAVQ